MSPRRRPVWPLLTLLAIVVITYQDRSLTAQPKAGPILVPPQAPTLNPPFPFGVQRGQSIELTLAGANLNDPVALWTSFPAKATFATDMNNGKDAGSVRVKLEVPADAPIDSVTVSRGSV